MPRAFMTLALFALTLTGWSMSAGAATQDTGYGKSGQSTPNQSGGQQSPDRSKDQAKDSAKVAEGELARVDSRNQMLWIKSGSGKEMEFSYTDQTKVEGAGGSIEGLASMGGTFVKVQYDHQGTKNVATNIEVQQQGTTGRQGASPSRQESPSGQEAPTR